MPLAQDKQQIFSLKHEEFCFESFKDKNLLCFATVLKREIDDLVINSNSISVFVIFARNC